MYSSTWQKGVPFRNPHENLFKSRFVTCPPHSKSFKQNNELPIPFSGPNVSCGLKTGNSFLVIEQKNVPKKLSFEHSKVMENFN